MKCHLKSAGESSLNVYLLRNEFNLFTQTYIFCLASHTSTQINNIEISWQKIFLSPSISDASCTFQTWYKLDYIGTDNTHEMWYDRRVCHLLVKFPILLSIYTIADKLLAGSIYMPTILFKISESQSSSYARKIEYFSKMIRKLTLLVIPKELLCQSLLHQDFFRLSLYHTVAAHLYTHSLVILWGEHIFPLTVVLFECLPHKNARNCAFERS